MAEAPILVFGATGRTGRRRLADRGVEVLAGSLDDRSALGAAMRGVQGVFALTTPFEAGVDAEVAQGRAIVAAALDTQVPHLVFSSVAGANQHTGVPHFDSKASSKPSWPQAVCPTPSPPRPTSSTTLSAASTVSVRESSICHYRQTVRCSS